MHTDTHVPGLALPKLAYEPCGMLQSPAPPGRAHAFRTVGALLVTRLGVTPATATAPAPAPGVLHVFLTVVTAGVTPAPATLGVGRSTVKNEICFQTLGLFTTFS